MPTFEQTELVLGRGEVYFDPFLPGTKVCEGERYIGNTPRFRIERSLETIERYSSYGGKLVRRPSSVVSESHTVNFITDHMAMSNLAMWYGDQIDAPALVSNPPATESFVVKRGRFYQLGKSLNISGVRNISFAQVMLNGAEIAPPNNFELDLGTGMLQILPDAVDISDGQMLEVYFDHKQALVENLESSVRPLIGALRYVAKNSVGKRTNYYFPQVEIAPVGQFDVKADQWQQLQFAATASNLNPLTEQVYVDSVATVLPNTFYEQVLADNDMSAIDMIRYSQIVRIDGRAVDGVPITILNPDGQVYVDADGNLLGVYL